MSIEPREIAARLRRLLDQHTLSPSSPGVASNNGPPAPIQLTSSLRDEIVRLTADLEASVRAELSLIAFGDRNMIEQLSIGDVAGGNIMKIYPPEATDDPQKLLTYYFQTLSNKYGLLHLYKFLGKEMNGREDRTAPTVHLKTVFTEIVANYWMPEETFELHRDKILEQMDAAHPGRVLPRRVRIPAILPAAESADIAFRQRYGLDTQRVVIATVWERVRQDVAKLPARVLAGRWYRPESPGDALQMHRRIVLLGPPGSGKSTLLRYMMITNVDDLSSSRHPIGPENPLPLYYQLSRITQRLTDDPSQDLRILVDALVGAVSGIDDVDARLKRILQAYMIDGRAIIYLDGLDEVSSGLRVTKEGQRISTRDRVAEAIRRLANHLPKTAIIVTCRTKPYEQSASWQLRDGWTFRILAPLTLGQVRHFVRTWYTHIGKHGMTLVSDEAIQRAERLYDTLEKNKPLHAITQSPLLLTMLALLDYNNKQLPAKRADVYDELVQLLLDRWEFIRSDDARPRQSIGERFDLIHLDMQRIREVVHELAYKAHTSAADERGTLRAIMLRDHLDQFFARQINPENPRMVDDGEKSQRSKMFERLLQEETGLIHEEDDDTYVFPHLTFEEYLCACYLADQEDPEIVYRHWNESGDRWREVILLLMGRLLSQGKYWMSFNWLANTLLSPNYVVLLQGKGRQPMRELRPKSAEQFHRDALFAAVCYNELGRQATMGGRAFNIDEFERQLCNALIAAMQQPSASIYLDQRLEITSELRALGDSRYPASEDEWAQSVALAATRPAKAQAAPAAGSTKGPLSYWCYVSRGAYNVGGWADQPPQRLRMEPFWMARYPITVRQFRVFINQGGPYEYQKWLTAYGRIWQDRNAQAEPWDVRHSLVYGDSQPVMGVSWYEAAAFANWLNARMRAQGALPKGYSVRLPTEAEWEIAAAPLAGPRPRYPWGDSPPTAEHAIYEAAAAGGPVPVGCCPLGQSALGVMDLAGNVWELTASDARGYPARSHQPLADMPPDARIAWRGGHWDSDAQAITCGVRDLNFAHIVYGVGFRLVLGPG